MVYHKVIIDIYVSITIFFLPDFLLFQNKSFAFVSVGLFILLCFLPREVPLAIVVKLVCWCWILLTFAYL